MTHTDPNIEPPLPDLDDIISKVGEWEECFASLTRQEPRIIGSHVAHEAFETAYVALSHAKKALEIIEQESVA